MTVVADRLGPFKEGAEVPRLWPFSVNLLRPELQRGRWFAFEDWDADGADLNSLVRVVMRPCAWRVEWPEVGPTFRLVSPPSTEANAVLLNLVRYGGNIIWDDGGRVFINYFSDFLLTNLSDADATSVFGCPLPEMWAQSENCFTELDRNTDPEAQHVVRQFVNEMKATWSEGAVN